MTALFQRLPIGQRFLMALVITAVGACTLPLAGQQAKSPDGPNPDLIKPGDWLRIQVVGTLPDAPIKDLYQVEASGKIALGPEYGRVQVKGKTLEQAEAIVLEHLATLLAAPKLQITRYEPPPQPPHSADQALERRVEKLEREVQRLQRGVPNLPKAPGDDADAKARSGYGSAAAKAHPVEAKAVLAAAKDFWDAKMAMQEIGVLTFSEDLHLGSCRLLDAEKALADTQEAEQAALLAHWKRMEDIHRKIRALFDTGTKGGEPDKLAAAKSYRAEAELWLVEAGGAVPDDRLE